TVVMLDLRRHFRAVEPQALLNEAVAEGYPIHRRKGDVVGIERAGRAAELGGIGHLREEPRLPCQPFGKHRDLFAERHGRCGLPARARAAPSRAAVWPCW